MASNPAGISDQMYQDLHTKISGRSFNSQVVQALNGIVDVLTIARALLTVRVLGVSRCFPSRSHDHDPTRQ